MKTNQCYVCSNTVNNKEYSFSDLHFKIPGTYLYFQCPNCGCLQYDRNSINKVPYYPPNYYSFKSDDGSSLSSKLKWLLRSKRNSFYESGKGILGAFIHKILPCMSVAAISKIKDIQKSWNILDVGCGNDALMLQYLSSKNYTNLTGIDPYISKDFQQIGMVKLLKKSIDVVDGKFDLITFNHSFEHMTQQREALINCGRLLADNGLVLIRIPVVDSLAWNQYKEFWANLDAPRHYFLHSSKSIKLLIEQCGFKIKSSFYDSTSFQFWGSQLYKSGFRLGGQRHILEKVIQIVFRIYYSVTMNKKIKYLNSESKGDSIAILIEKSDINL